MDFLGGLTIYGHTTLLRMKTKRESLNPFGGIESTENLKKKKEKEKKNSRGSSNRLLRLFKGFYFLFFKVTQKSNRMAFYH
jgi:hypothetical protein